MKIQRVMWMLVALAFAAGSAFAQKPDAAKVKQMLTKTHKVIAHASAVVKKDGKGKEDLHKAIVRNKAARKSLKQGKPLVAAYLTLKARNFARAAIKANHAAVPKEEAADAPEEAKAAEGADTAQADSVVSETDQEVPATADSEDADADASE